MRCATFAAPPWRPSPWSWCFSLGLGTNVVLFSVLNSLATMPAPGIARDESLVRIRGTLRTGGTAGVESRLMSWPEVQEYAQRSDLFSGVAALAEATAVVDTGDAMSPSVTVRLIYTTANYFSVLGVRPELGSEPAAEQDVTRLTTSPTAMISYAMWRRRFGGAPDVLGRSLRVDDIPIEIVGVAPPKVPRYGRRERDDDVASPRDVSTAREAHDRGIPQLRQHVLERRGPVASRRDDREGHACRRRRGGAGVSAPLRRQGTRTRAPGRPSHRGNRGARTSCPCWRATIT